MIQLFLDKKSIIHPSGINTINFLNTSEEIIRGLKAVDDGATNRDPWFIKFLFQKFDRDSRILWSKESTKT